MSAQQTAEIRRLQRQLRALEERVALLENRGSDPPISPPPFPREWLHLGLKPREGVEVS